MRKNLYKYLADKITNKYVANKILSTEDREMYSYGFEVLFSIKK